MPVKKAGKECFVKVWNSSKSAADVAAQFGMTIHGTRSKASELRKEGFQLKQMGASLNSKSDIYDEMTAEKFTVLASQSSSYDDMAKLTGEKSYTLQRIAKQLGITPVWGMPRQRSGKKKKIKKSEKLNQIANLQGFGSWGSLVNAICAGECTITIHKK